MTSSLTHLERVEAAALHILRESLAEARRPVLLFSGGEDSTVLAYLTAAAFHLHRSDQLGMNIITAATPMTEVATQPKTTRALLAV